MRFRLTRPEVEGLRSNGFCEERTIFPGKTFSYLVKAVKGLNTLEANFREDTIELQVPLKNTKEWPENDVVGFEHFVPLENGSSLHLLIEKDFVCLDQPIETQADNYPNPKADLKQ